MFEKLRVEGVLGNISSISFFIHDWFHITVDLIWGSLRGWIVASRWFLSPSKNTRMCDMYCYILPCCFRFRHISRALQPMSFCAVFFFSGDSWWHGGCGSLYPGKVKCTQLHQENEFRTMYSHIDSFFLQHDNAWYRWCWAHSSRAHVYYLPWGPEAVIISIIVYL